MNIADYFIGRTKPIEYIRNHYKTVSMEGDWIVLEPFQTKDAYAEDASDEERHQAIIREFRDYGIRTLSDNHMLCTALAAVESALEDGKACYTRPIMQELYPAMTTRIHKDDFTAHITALRLLFLCYREIVWDEPCLTSDQLAAIRRICSPEEEAGRSAICWEYVSYVLTFFHDNAIESRLKMNPPTLYEVQRARSLYHALLHQLLLHIAAGKDGLDGYHLAECQSCHQPFKKKHGNTKFCILCGRNSERVRDYKRRAKEKQHAQETHP